MARPSKNPPFSELLEGMERIERRKQELQSEEEDYRKKLLLSELRNYAYVGRKLWEKIANDTKYKELVHFIDQDVKEHRVFNGWNLQEEPLFSMSDFLAFSVADVRFAQEEEQEELPLPKIDRRKKEHKNK